MGRACKPREATGTGIAAGAGLGTLASLTTLASSGSADAANRAGPATSGPLLSGREQEVVRLVAEGLSNTQIAPALSITQRIVKMHIASAMNKRGAANRAHAAVLATPKRLL